jgi:hypothetical protein
MAITRAEARRHYLFVLQALFQNERFVLTLKAK